jgi:osmoprotectant transport system permease protein
MSGLLDGIHWLTDPAHWSGPNAIGLRTLQHVELSASGIVLAAIIALPAGLAIGHTRRGEVIAVQIANIGRAIPSLAILSLAYLVALSFAPSFAFGFLPTLVALTLLGIPPILVNTYVGIKQVDADTVEAARGMGMSERQVLFGLEVPLAVPLIMTGLRLAAVTIVATAALSALIAGGTLGRYIVDGIAQQDIPQVVGGSILIAALAIVTDLIFSILRRVTAPRLSSSSKRPASVPA